MRTCWKTLKLFLPKGVRKMAERYINAYDFAETIENLDITVAGKPARWNDAKYTVLQKIAQCPDADVVPREEHEELIYKLECLLCCASGSKLSKHTYDLKTMETVVNDYINESYYDGAKDTAKEIFAEIRKIVTAIYNKHIFGSDLEDEEKEAVMDFEVDISSDFDELEEKYGITDTAPKE